MCQSSKINLRPCKYVALINTAKSLNPVEAIRVNVMLVQQPFKRVNVYKSDYVGHTSTPLYSVSTGAGISVNARGSAVKVKGLAAVLIGCVLCTIYAAGRVLKPFSGFVSGFLNQNKDLRLRVG